MLVSLSKLLSFLWTRDRLRSCQPWPSKRFHSYGIKSILFQSYLFWKIKVLGQGAHILSLFRCRSTRSGPGSGIPKHLCRSVATLLPIHSKSRGDVVWVFHKAKFTSYIGLLFILRLSFLVLKYPFCVCFLMFLFVRLVSQCQSLRFFTKFYWSVKSQLQNKILNHNYQIFTLFTFGITT